MTTPGSKMRAAFGSFRDKANQLSPTPRRNKPKNRKPNFLARFGKNDADENKMDEESIVSGPWTLVRISNDGDIANDSNILLQCDNSRVTVIPVGEEANPSFMEYLNSFDFSSISIDVDESSDTVRLVRVQDDADDEIILEGKLTNTKIEWNDGSLWERHQLAEEPMENGDDGMVSSSGAAFREELSQLDQNELLSRACEMNERLQVLTEKEQMAKMQTREMYDRVASISSQLASAETDKKEAVDKYKSIANQLEAAELGSQTMKASFEVVSKELSDLKNDVVFESVQKSNLKAKQLEQENSELKRKLEGQAETIHDLQVQLQHAQLAAREYASRIQQNEKKSQENELELTRLRAAMNEMSDKCVDAQQKYDEIHSQFDVVVRDHEKQIEALQRKNKDDMMQLERGFQATLQINETKMQELEAIRNNFAKKNASLTKHVRSLITQIEQQAKNVAASSEAFEAIRSSGNVSSEDLLSDSDPSANRLREENQRLSEELIRKSQSLVDALRALAEIQQEDQQETMRITQSLSRTRPRAESEASMHSDVAPSFDAVSTHLHAQMSADLLPETGGSSSATTSAGPRSPQMNGRPVRARDKFRAFGARMKTRAIAEGQKLDARMKQLKVQAQQVAGPKRPQVVDEIRLTKPQLLSKCSSLRELANELSSTIEQKEEVIGNLRFANTYLGKRVINLEKHLNIPPGSPLPDDFNPDFNTEEPPKKHVSFAEVTNLEAEPEEKEDIPPEPQENATENDDVAPLEDLPPRQDDEQVAAEVEVQEDVDVVDEEPVETVEVVELPEPQVDSDQHEQEEEHGEELEEPEAPEAPEVEPEQSDINEPLPTNDSAPVETEEV